MATLQAHTLLISSSTPSSNRRRPISSNLHLPINPKTSQHILQKLPTRMINMLDLSLRKYETVTKTIPMASPKEEDDSMVLSKLYTLAEAAADRAEMHAIIGEQRNNWAHLLPESINTMTLTASVMAGVATMVPAFKLSSALLFTAAAGIMAITNKIQPSQLVEEQRNAARLFKQLERSIQTRIYLGDTKQADVDEAMERVLALDKAYPLPLFPEMLEKFPKNVEPTVWWPKVNLRQKYVTSGRVQSNNGWSEELETEMKGILRVIKRKDTEQYLRLGKLLVHVNRTMAISGPVLAGLAAVGAGLVGSPSLGSWPVLVAVIGGVLASLVNTLEHGGQVGMVFELFRNCAGFYTQIEEEIEANLGEEEVDKRENGELFETKVALRLGRSLSEMKAMASYATFSCEDGEDIAEFAGKLF